MKSIIQRRESILFIILAGFFITNALIAELIGVKVFSFESSIGIAPINWSLFGIEGNLDLSAGVLLWPVVFIFTDIINEYFGKRGVQLLSYLTVGLIIYAFIMIFWAIGLEPASWWITTYESQGIDNMQVAYKGVFGQGMWIIVGSVIAFLLGQLIDVLVFHKIKKMTGEQRLWLRATGSTVVSQLIDTVVVLYIAFVLPGVWELTNFFAVVAVQYTYKFLVALTMTPIIYGLHYVIDNFVLGEELAEQLKRSAAEN